MVRKVSELYQEGRKLLAQGEDQQSANMIARNLLCHVTGKPWERLLADFDQHLTDAESDAFFNAVSKILAGVPLAYVLGEWDFYGMTLSVNPSVLIPRDDTCAVTELAIEKARSFKKPPWILDLCTGSGCIGLAVASRVQEAKVILADISDDALAVAKDNITAQNLSERVTCVVSDALGEPAATLGVFDVIVSNPPYITAEEMTQLPDSVKDHEPHLALFGGDDGLDFYRAIAKNYRKVLKPGGYLCFEFGMGQGDDVCRILEENSYTILERSRDYNDRERAVLAQR